MNFYYRSNLPLPAPCKSSAFSRCSWDSASGREMVFHSLKLFFSIPSNFPCCSYNSSTLHPIFKCFSTILCHIIIPITLVFPVKNFLHSVHHLLSVIGIHSLQIFQYSHPFLSLTKECSVIHYFLMELMELKNFYFIGVFSEKMFHFSGHKVWCVKETLCTFYIQIQLTGIFLLIILRYCLTLCYMSKMLNNFTL